MQQEEGSRAKVKKGHVAVRVGLEKSGEEGLRRFTIPISYLHHPKFARLLEAAGEAYGYDSSGPLKLPCSADDFLHLRWLIDRESSSTTQDSSHSGAGGGGGGHHHHHLSSLSFRSC